MEARSLSGFTIFEAHDADDLAKRSYLLRHLPRPNGAHSYALRTALPRHAAERALVTRHATRKAGHVQLSYVVDRLGTAIGITGSGIDYHCFSLFLGGAMSLSLPGRGAETVGTVQHGTIHRGEVGTRALTVDGTSRLNLWVSTARLHALLAASIDDMLRTPLSFDPALDWDKPAIASLKRMILLASKEFAQADGLASSPLALAAFTDMFVQTSLANVRHTYSDRLSRRLDTPVPRHLRRAEAFIRAHAPEPLTMEQIAGSAGCSVRTLQLAYRRFRATTPHAALMDVRLDRLRTDLAATDEPVAVVARRWGFTNAGRLTAQFRRRFGETPVAARRGPNSGA